MTRDRTRAEYNAACSLCLMLAMPTAIQQSHRDAVICSSITSYFPVSVLSVYFQLSVIFIYLFHILNYYLGIKQFHNFVRYFVVSAAAERRGVTTRGFYCYCIQDAACCTVLQYNLHYTALDISTLHYTALLFCTAQITF